MTERERQDERDDLDLEVEEVKDLDPSPENADDVFGGGSGTTRPNLGQAGSHST